MTRASGHDCAVIILRVAGELVHTKRNAASVVHCLLRAVGVYATVHCAAFATTIFTNTRIAKRHVFHVHRELESRGKRRETDADAFTRAAPDATPRAATKISKASISDTGEKTRKP